MKPAGTRATATPGDDYLFGIEPNHFLGAARPPFSGWTHRPVRRRRRRPQFVWLAEQGLKVTAVEISPIAVGQGAQACCRAQRASEFRRGRSARSGLAACCTGEYIRLGGRHFHPVRQCQRTPAPVRAMKRATRSGGRVLLHGYTPRQLEYKTGGPSAAENLYTPEMLRTAFADWTIEQITEYDDDIAEGSGHRGHSALIGMVARKPQP